jgi:hypothetical protein
MWLLDQVSETYGSKQAAHWPPYGGIDFGQISATILQDVDEFLLNCDYGAFPFEPRDCEKNQVFPVLFDAEIKEDMAIVMGDEECIGTKGADNHETLRMFHTLINRYLFPHPVN